MSKALRIFAPFLLVMVVFALGLSVTSTSAQQFGTNWTVTFFSDTTLTTQVIANVDSQISENNTTISQLSAGRVSQTNFSARWQGTQEFASAGTYRFTAVYDDGIRVTIDGTTVINDFVNNNTQKVAQVEANIAAGARQITVEYVQFSGNAIVQFYWDPVNVSSTGTQGPTPTPTATGLPPIPAGALTGTVIRAGILNVRDAPSTGGGVVGRVLRGQTYQIVGRNEDATWFVLQLGGYQGWVFGYYLYPNRNEYDAPVVSATNLAGLPAGFNDTGVMVQTRATMRMRSEPSVTAPQTGRVSWGAFLPVSGRTAAGDWYQVLWRGSVGWVYTGFLEIVQGDYASIPVIR